MQNWVQDTFLDSTERWWWWFRYTRPYLQVGNKCKSDQVDSSRHLPHSTYSPFSIYNATECAHLSSWVEGVIQMSPVYVYRVRNLSSPPCIYSIYIIHSIFDFERHTENVILTNLLEFKCSVDLYRCSC